MKLYLEINIRPYLRMWKSNDNGTSNKKVMKKFYELFAQPSYKQTRTKHSKHKTEQKHKRSTKEVPPWNGQ